MARAPSLVLMALVPLGLAIDGSDLVTFFQKRLGMPHPDEKRMEEEAYVLDTCAITLANLTSLANVLEYRMDWSKSDLQSDILKIAEQKIHAEHLLRMYTVLTDHTGMNMSEGHTASFRALELLEAHAIPNQVEELYKVLREIKAVPNEKEAGAKAIELARAGCDAAELKKEYEDDTTHLHDLSSAVKSAVRRNLYGYQERYDKTGKLRTAAEFQTVYKDAWLGVWLKAPQEERVYEHEPMTLSEFHIAYSDATGLPWHVRWLTREEVTLRRFGEDGPVNLTTYIAHHGDSWQEMWSSLPEMPCEECGK